MTPFAAYLATSNVTYEQAAHHFGLPVTTIEDWASGRSKAPDEATEWAHQLIVGMLTKANTLTAAYEDLKANYGEPGEIEIGISTDDHEAQLNGFMSKTHERATMGLALAQLPTGVIKLVPRGSTLGTAAAEAQHKS